MKSIFDKINMIKLEAQDMFLSFALKDSLKPTYQKNFCKKHFSKGCSLDINAEAELKIAAVKTRAFELVNIYNKSTLALIEYIESRGYTVIQKSQAKKWLTPVEEKPGIIPAAKGFKALYLNIVSGKGLSFSSEPIIFLESKNVPIIEFLHDFYLWCALDMGLPGFESETRNLFIKYFIKGEDSLLKTIQINQMLMLKQAIARDKEAIEFVIDFEKLNKNSKLVHEESDIPTKISI